MTAAVPVLTIDGPTASGKGTIAARVAETLGWHYLDSGALYRLVALEALGQGLDLDDVAAVATLAGSIRPRFEHGRVWLGERDVSDAIRAEIVGNTASRVAVMPPVRQALVTLQQGFRQAPGLVADGRDMGTVIFPDARLKIFLTADVSARAERRHRQLLDKGHESDFNELLRVLQERDRRDTTRATAPLAPAADAVVVDSTELDVDQTVAQVLQAWRSRLADPPLSN